MNSGNFYLVRHGVTPANKENRFAGRTAETLHPEGVAQIRRVGEELRHYEIAAVYCGPLPRTMMSAQILAAQLGVPVEVADALNEIYIPHWDGLTKQAIREEFGGQYPLWCDYPQQFRLPGCETLAMVQDRAVNLVEGLWAARPGENLLVVSHLIVLRCLALYYQGRPLQDFRRLQIDNGSITHLARAANGGALVTTRGTAAARAQK